MAKSYVTKFVEYVAEQRDKFESALKNIGVPVDKNMSFGNMTSLLATTNIDLSYGYEYKRDENFPDIDYMFDNDPLRFANGGEYKYCVYSIVRVIDDNTVYFPTNYSYAAASGGYKPYFSKVYIGDNIIIDIPDNTSSTSTVSVTKYVLSEEEQSQLITGEDGFKYILARAYYNNEQSDRFYAHSSSSGNQYGFGQCVETISDTSDYPRSFSRPTTTNGYAVISKYVRYPLSNSNPETAMANTGQSLSMSSAVECFRMDGVAYLKEVIGNCNNIILNCEIVLPSTITSGTLLVGSTNNPGYSTTLSNREYTKGTFISPFSAKNITLSCSGFAPQNIILREGIVVVMQNSNSLNPFTNAKKIAFPSSIYNINSLSMSNAIKVRTTPGAFGTAINSTTAYTIDFSYAYDIQKESILEFFNNVADRTGAKANIVKVSKRVANQLTEEEKAIITNKNWTISVGTY